MGGSPKRRQKNAKPSRPKASSTLTKVSPVSATTTDTMAPSDASAPASKPAALSPPEPPAHRRAHRQFARLLGAVLDEFGINGPIAQSKALGLKHHQTIQQLFDSREEKEKSLSEENYVRVESAVRQLIRDRGAQRTKGHTRGAIAVSISGTCRPLAMLGKLRQRVQGRYIPQRFLYDSDEAARLWETTEHGGDGDRATAIANVRRFVQTRIREHLTRPDVASIELISLACGNGAKEIEVLHEFYATAPRPDLRMRLVDSSIPLLCDAVKKVSKRFPDLRMTAHCSDIEDGDSADMRRWETTGGVPPRAPRIVMILGNVFGSIENEPLFVQTQLRPMLQPGDLLWIEVLDAFETTRDDPASSGLGRLPLAIEKATEPFDRMLTLPYLRDRRLEPLRDQDTSVSLHADLSGPTNIPGSYNLRHWLSIERDERRFEITVLHARRYNQVKLSEWFKRFDFVEVAHEVFPERHLEKPAPAVTRWIHLLLRYNPSSASTR